MRFNRVLATFALALAAVPAAEAGLISYGLCQTGMYTPPPPPPPPPPSLPSKNR
ncbi:hypothetical protein FRB93_009556 [Tulasnella sp. JGI-2019a]|nr:hypothetical protein FRB93_009556 [Tulasnella sp. JGI-2019a]